MGQATQFRQELASLQHQEEEVSKKIMEIRNNLEGYDKRLSEIRMQVQRVKAGIRKALQDGDI